VLRATAGGSAGSFSAQCSAVESDVDQERRPSGQDVTIQVASEGCEPCGCQGLPVIASWSAS
jgi:hypothetical protein